MNGNTIYHVQFGDDDNHYFGSIAAIFDKFTSNQLGVSKSRLYAYVVTPERPYRNNVVIIRKEVMHRKKGGRTKPI